MEYLTGFLQNNEYLGQEETVSLVIERLLQNGAEALYFINPPINVALVAHVFKNPKHHALGIFIIINAFNKIKELGNAQGNSIEQLIFKIAQSQNSKECLQQLKKDFDKKNINIEKLYPLLSASEKLKIKSAFLSFNWMDVEKNKLQWLDKPIQYKILNYTLKGNPATLFAVKPQQIVESTLEKISHLNK